MKQKRKTHPRLLAALITAQRIAHTALDITLAVTLVWLMRNYKELLMIITK